MMQSQATVRNRRLIKISTLKKETNKLEQLIILHIKWEQKSTRVNVDHDSTVAPKLSLRFQ